MTEEESVSVETESQGATPATEPEVTQEAQSENKQQKDVAYNWAELRKKTQELERKTREQEEIIHKLSQPKQAVEEDDLAKLGKDDIITVHQAEKIAERRARQIAEEVIRQREATTVDERLQYKFSDFNQVVTRENVENLKETEPELARSLSYITDPYEQGVAAYKLMKKLGVGVDMAKIEKEKAIKNSQKPVSANAAPKASAIGNAELFASGVLTSEMKKQLYKEMEDARKRA